jgi:sterol desaturase/sphingolipid hydroxylase (fatty acid hydroxylase superfamily)
VLVPVWLCAAALAFVFGSLAEYWGHRAMHAGFKRARHIEHHQSGSGQGFSREFFGYTLSSWPFFAIGLLYSLEAGVGFAVGGLFYSAFAAYAHELQHEHPECCFWLSQPLHHVHHAEKMWQHNFGITVDIWDRVFGTYRRSDYQRPERRAWRNLLRVKWR